MSKTTDKEIYRSIVEEQPYCMLCGSTYWLQIHHIYYRSQGGLTIKKNLIRLCDKCHKLVHSNKKKYQPMLLEIQYKKYGHFTKQSCLKNKY